MYIQKKLKKKLFDLNNYTIRTIILYNGLDHGSQINMIIIRTYESGYLGSAAYCCNCVDPGSLSYW